MTLEEVCALARMRELVEDAWALVVPKKVAEEYAAAQGYDV